MENEHLIVYRIKDLEGIDSAKSLIVLLNGGSKQGIARIPFGHYSLLAFNAVADVNGLDQIATDAVTVAPYSATILAEK